MLTLALMWKKGLFLLMVILKEEGYGLGKWRWFPNGQSHTLRSRCNVYKVECELQAGLFGVGQIT